MAMEEELLNKMMLFVEQVSPELWEWALRAVYAEAIANVVLATIWTVVLAFSVFLLLLGIKKGAENGWETAVFFGAIGGFAGACGVCITAARALSLLNAPEFHAIKILILKSRELLG